MAGRIKDRDRGYKRIMALPRQAAGNPHVAAGVTGKKAEERHQDDPLTVAEVATYNHFGTDTIPARPFISATVDKNRGKIESTQKRLLKIVLAGKLTPKKALDTLGVGIVGMVRQAINQGFPPPNADATVEKKGSSQPLVDSAQMKGAVDHEVRDK